MLLAKAAMALLLAVAGQLAACASDCNGDSEMVLCNGACYLDFQYIFCGDRDHCIACPVNSLARCGGTPTAPTCYLPSPDGGP